MNFANFVQIIHESAVGFCQINVTHMQNLARISGSFWTCAVFTVK